MECSLILKDLYKKIDEEYHIEYNAMLHELKFGYVPYDTKTLMTYKQPPMRRQQRYMNKNRAGIRYRLLNELLAEEFTEYSEKYKKVEESVRIKMYKVDANGNEIIEREE